MTQNKSIFLLKYNTNHHLCIKTIYSIFSQKNVDVNCCLFLNQNLFPNNSDLYQKIIFLIRNNFTDLINEKKLYLIDVYDNYDYLPLIRSNYKIFNKYNVFIPIESKNIYFPSYASNAIEFLNNNNSNTLKIKSFYGIDINNTVVNKPNIHTFIYTKNSLNDNKNISNYISQDYISYINDTKDKLYVIDNKFNVVWVKENKNSLLKDSYLFLYKVNNKVFNVENNTHGIIEQINSNDFTISWSINSEYITYSYRLTDENIFVNIAQ